MLKFKNTKAFRYVLNSKVNIFLRNFKGVFDQCWSPKRPVKGYLNFWNMKNVFVVPSYIV